MPYEPKLADNILNSEGYAKSLAKRREAALGKVVSVDPDGSVNEQSLALSWQIPRSALSTIRKSRLREHWHWKYGPSKNHGDVRITKEGIEELRKWVVPPEKVVPVEAPEGVVENVRPEAVPNDPNIVVVYRIPPNPRMLLARDFEGLPVSIRVSSNSKFRAGMKIDLGVQCVRLYSEGHADPDRVYQVWAFRGKLPRSYGRW